MKKILLLLITFLCLSTTSAFATVDAVDDTYTMSYLPSGSGLSFFTTITSNDIYSGTINVQLISSPSRGIYLSGSNVTVLGTVLPGTYVLTYQICDNLIPQSCDTATITVIVLSANANDDTYTVTQGTSTTLSPSTLSNDSFQGVAATDANTNMTLLTTVSGISLNTTTGAVTVGAFVAAGTYTLTYQLCDAVTTSYPCDTATITINVMNSVNAVDDEFGLPYSATATALGNIRLNDFYDGVTPTSANVTITFLSPLPAGLTYNTSTGVLTSTGVAMGNYLITYQMCDTMFPTNCDTATIAISVGYPINAVNDEYVKPYTSGIVNLGNILVNDSYNGSTPTTSNVGVSFLTALPTGVLYNSTTGNLSYTNLPVGQYVITYKLCDGIYTSNCDTATVTIYVTTQNGPLVTSRANGTVRAIGIQSNNKIIIAGDFTSYGGSLANKIVRLNSEDLSLDTSFNVNGPDSPTDIIKDFKILPSNNILLVGKFASFGSLSQARGISMLLQNGVLGGPFNPDGTGVPAGQTINSLAIFPNGNIVIVGDFTSYNGLPRKNIALLTPAGDPILSFNPLTSFNGIPTSVVIHNNKIIVGGDFSTYQGATANKLIRLDISANLDTSFNAGQPGIAPTSGTYVEELVLDGNDLYVGGLFSSYDGLNRKGLVKISAATGYPIATFNTGVGFPGLVRAIAIQRAPASYAGTVGVSNLYVGGDFTSFNNVSVPKLVCLNSITGAVNTFFNPGAGPDNNVHAITMEANHLKVLIGGEFTNYNGGSAERITRIFPGFLGTGNVQGRIGTEEIAVKEGISIYPNPSEGIFNIDFKGYDEQKFDMTIHNALGQVIYKGVVIPQNTNQIDLTRFDSGSYFITLQTGNETINKIVVKK